MKRWLVLPILLTGLLMVVAGEPRSAEQESYEIIKMLDPALEEYEIGLPCYQFGTGIYGCPVKGEDDLWAVNYEWIRLSTDPGELIQSTEIMKMDLYSKIDTSVKRIPAYYMRAISATSVENARRKALDSGYMDPPAALVDSVKADIDRVER
jgi:hypothetical protein